MFLPAVLLSDFFSNREKYKPICARKNEYQKKKILIKIKIFMLRHGRSEFLLRAEPERSEGGGARRSVAVPNGEGVASGSATQNFKFLILINIFFF